MTALAAPVFAADPVTLDGDVAIKFARQRVEGEPSVSGPVYTLRLNGEADLGSGWSLYARLGAQYAKRPSLGDYDTDVVYGEDEKTVATLDMFGLKYKKGGFEYKFGRQDLGVGATSLLYSRADSNIGHRNFVDGLTISGKTGVVDLNAVVAKEDSAGSDDNRIYAVHAGLQPTEAFNYGVTLGRYDNKLADVDDTNHWAVDAGYKLGKHSLTAEYAKSDKNEANKAYAATWNYGFDKKAAVYLTSFRVEANADMGGQSDFDNDNKGLYYGATYQFNDNDGIEVVYKDQKTIEDGKKNNKLEATFTHSF